MKDNTGHLKLKEKIRGDDNVSEPNVSKDLSLVVMEGNTGHLEEKIGGEANVSEDLSLAVTTGGTRHLRQRVKLWAKAGFALASVLFLGFSGYQEFWGLQPSLDKAARKEWRITEGRVSTVGTNIGAGVETAYEPGENPNYQYREDLVTYSNWNGQAKTISLQLKPGMSSGAVVPLEVSRSGKVWAKTSFNADGGENPLHPEKRNTLRGEFYESSFVIFWIPGALGALLGALLALATWTVGLRTAWGGWARVAGRKLALALSSALDRWSLRRETRQRERRLGPSPFYAWARRTQARLERMEDVPAVREARGKVESFLESIRERDALEAVHVAHASDAMREEVEKDILARHLAAEELAGAL